MLLEKAYYLYFVRMQEQNNWLFLEHNILRHTQERKKLMTVAHTHIMLIIIIRLVTQSKQTVIRIRGAGDVLKDCMNKDRGHLRAADNREVEWW